MTDTYDEQIEALLVNDFANYCRITGQRANNHYSAWMNCGTDSLFSFLPGVGSGCCASMIEYPEQVYTPTPEVRSFYNGILENANLKLPDMNAVNSAVREKNFRYTREELEEFARRQRVAKELTNA